MSTKRKGIILAGGNGSRLYPMTQTVSKQLLAVYDKPMIYYPLTTLMLAGIQEILIIALPKDIPSFKLLLGDGKQWGMHFEYAQQAIPRGLADAFILGERFLNDSPVALILGDNIFHSDGLAKQLQTINNKPNNNTIFAYKVKDPKAYGVVTFNQNGKAIDIEEKPEHTNSPYAIPGLYFYDKDASKIAKTIQPSARGELEITDMHLSYMQQNKLDVEILKRGTAWFDGGTPQTLLQTSLFIETLEERQGVKVGCPEEVALRMNFINNVAFQSCVDKMKDCQYKSYLTEILNEL